MADNDNAAGTYTNTSTHPVDLDDGRVIGVGESADIEKQRLSARERHLVESGQLTTSEQPPAGKTATRKADTKGEAN